MTGLSNNAPREIVKGAIKNAIGLAKQTMERDICRIIKEVNYE